MDKKTFFRFEADFVDSGIRCIPMVVRFKLDLAGVKLLLQTWVRCNFAERQLLVNAPCDNEMQISGYRRLLISLSEKHSGQKPKLFEPEHSPSWQLEDTVPGDVQLQAVQYGWKIKTSEWSRLEVLQRFALVKLCRPGHENKNFPHAMEEFGWERRTLNQLP